MWYILFAGVATLSSVLPQTRNKVKDVPWTAIALTLGLGHLLSVLGDSTADARNSFAEALMRSQMNRSADYEEAWDVQYSDDAIACESFADLTRKRDMQYLKGLTLVRRRRPVI